MRDGTLAKLSRDGEFAGGLDIFGGESRLLAVDHEHPAFCHDLIELVRAHGVHRVHGLLRDSHFRRGLLQHAEDVGLESAFISAKTSLLCSESLLLQKLIDTWLSIFKFLLFISVDVG